MPGGRPSKYQPKYASELIKFFKKKPFSIKKQWYFDKDGKKTHFTLSSPIPNPLPTFEAFASKIEVNGDTLVEWASATTETGELKYPEFSAAYKRAKELQKNLLIQNGLIGLYTPAFAIFTAKNITDMRDVREIAGDPNNPIKHEHDHKVSDEYVLTQADLIRKKNGEKTPIAIS